MRFESIRVGRYGCLSDLATGDTPLPRIVAVLGPNESGKSTFFHFLSTMLYGFRPATRARHPYTPWSGGDPEGGAFLRLDDGTVQEVHRRLLAAPRGTLTAGGRTLPLGNRPIPATEHVAWVVFRHVYALTLSELADLGRKSWDLVQDRLVGAMAAPDLRPARRVAADFEQEGARLWRPDRRGRPRARILQGELRRLNKGRRELLDRDRLLRKKVEEMSEAEARLTALREERAAARERSRGLEYRLNRLLPVRRALRRIGELRRQAGEVAELAGLPADPEATLAELRRTAREAADRVKGLESGIAAAARATHEVEARLEEHGRQWFSVAWEEVDRRRLGGVPIGDLREMVDAYGEKRERRRIAEEGLREETLDGLRKVTPSGRLRLVTGLTGVVFGGGLAVVARHFPELLRPAPDMEASPGIVFPVGVGVVVLGFFALVLWLDRVRHGRRYRKAFEAAERGRRTEIRGLAESERMAKRAVAETLQGVPVRASVLEAPARDLPAAIERMTELLADRRARTGAAARELERIRDEREDAESEREAAAARLAAFEERLRGLGDGDPERGAAVAQRRLDAWLRANQLRGELEREHPTLDAIEREIREADDAGQRWESLAASLEAAEAGRLRLTRRAEELQAAIGRLDSEVRHLQEGDTVDRAEGRIASLKSRIRETREQRDRAFVLARLVREADRRFRDEHQPDLLLRAAGHLCRITRGRYDRIELGGPGDEGLHLRGPAAAAPRQVGEALSQGTREQVYLALRLAIVDHLDADGERLPLFMDETLVNWDAWRRERAFQLVERVAERRQVFLFTCHPAMAADLEDRGGRIIALDVR